jgi:hypothetical protein
MYEGPKRPRANLILFTQDQSELLLSGIHTDPGGIQPFPQLYRRGRYFRRDSSLIDLTHLTQAPPSMLGSFKCEASFMNPQNPLSYPRLISLNNQWLNTHHRSGWPYVIESLLPLHSQCGILVRRLSGKEIRLGSDMITPSVLPNYCRGIVNLSEDPGKWTPFVALRRDQSPT